MNAVRIAFFIDDYLPSVHGVATSTATFRAALERMGHEVYVVAPKAEGYEETDDHVIRLSSSRYYVFDSREVATIYPGLARRFDAYEFDIVHSQTQFSLGVLAHWVAKRQNIPHVTTIHTLYTELIDDYPLAVLSGLLALSVAFPVALKSQPVLPRVHRETIKHLNKRDMKTALSRQGWRLTAAFANKCNACLSPSQHLAQVLIDDGALVASRPGESEVVTTITVKKDGTAAGSFELPEYVEQGNHWLRFRVFGAQGESGQEGNAADYTNKSPYFTVSGVTVIGGSAPPTVPPAPTPPPRQVAASGRANGTAAGIQAAGPGGESSGFPIIGAFVLGLSVILVVLSVLVAINRRRMAAYQRRRAMA